MKTIIVEPANPMIRAALDAGEDATGLGTVRDMVQCMFEGRSDTCELFYIHQGRRFNVELKIKDCSDENSRT